MDIIELPKEREEELDELFKEEIIALKENTITKEDFIKIIRLKTTSFLDLYYLVNKYVRRIIIVDNIVEEIKNHLSSNDIYIDTEDNLDITYNKCQKQKTPHIKNLKKIKKYDNKNKFNRNKL